MLLWMLLDRDFYSKFVRFPLRFNAFGGFWMEISFKTFEISIEIE